MSSIAQQACQPIFLGLKQVHCAYDAVSKMVKNDSAIKTFSNFLLCQQYIIHTSAQKLESEMKTPSTPCCVDNAYHMETQGR